MDRVKMKCPFCLHTFFKRGWLTISYLDREYVYQECQNCRSLVCDPMPDTETLLEMYGPDYFDGEAAPDRFTAVTEKLTGLEPGVFLDYGCGDGSLLKIVSDLGWQAAGVEFNPKMVDALKKKYSFPIVLPDEPTPPADVLHMGDVIEHLTDIDTQLPVILERLRVGGLFIAHNPLEANPNLFASMLKLSRRLRGRAVIGVPHHVTHATTRGQRELFQRMGLETVSLDVSEISFPAPARTREAADGRQLFLYGIRKISQALSNILGVSNHGNRYLFVGRKAGHKPIGTLAAGQ